MRISIAIPSRNRPAGLLSVLTAMDHLSTGAHEITYGVVMDDDDYVTLEQWEHWKKSGMLPENALAFTGPRDKTVNARINDVFSVLPADVYSLVVDDQHPLTLHWDQILYGCRHVPAFCWQEATDPGNATFIITSQKWYDVKGRFITDYFPFWFADTWVAEVYKLAFGMPISIVEQLRMGHGRRGGTTGMRDLSFWFKFFAATRVERIAEAVAVANAWGKFVDVEKEREKELAEFRAADEWQLTQVPRYEAVFKANLGEPSKAYTIAKENALRWLHEHTEQMACA